MVRAIFHILVCVALPIGTLLRPLDYRYWEYMLDTYPDLVNRIEDAQIQDEVLNRAGEPPPLEAVSNFPSSDVHLGQVSGIGVDQDGDIHVLHRADRTWGLGTFNGDVFSNRKQGSIQSDVILKINKTTGEIVDSFGTGKFYLPHGLSVDNEGNLWATDVALHQVMKFPRGSHTPSLVLGEEFVPGNDNNHFCKPTDVAAASNGDFFVADGYCNGRIMKFSKTGSLLHQWGSLSRSSIPSGNDDFNIPHSLTLVEDRDMLCVADREHSRVQCFRAGLKDNNMTGEFMRSFHGANLGKVYAVSYDSNGDVMYAVSGPTERVTSAAGLTLNMDGNILEKWQEFNSQPHAVSVSPDGVDVYVGLLAPPVPLEKFHRDLQTELVG